MVAEDDEKSYICITQTDHHVIFTLIQGGRCASLQYHRKDVPEPANNVWTVRSGANPTHQSVRNAREQELVTVPPTQLMSALMARLQALLITPAQAA